jgi:SAM-dependent methyltransferase/cell division protein FtsB
VTTLRRQLEVVEADRAARLEVIEAQARLLGGVEAERNKLRAEVTALRGQLEVVEADRAARLEVIEGQGRQLGEVEGERNALRAELTALRGQREVDEADRAARLEVIEGQGRQLGGVEAERNTLRAELTALRGQREVDEADRAARLEVIEAQGRQLGEVEGERNTLRAEVTALRGRLEAVKADRAARLEVIEAQGRQLGEVEGERNTLRAEVTALRGQREAVKADRAARLEVIEAQGRQLGEVEGERNTLRAEVQVQLEQIQGLMAQLRGLQRSFQMIQSARAYRLLRRLGRWSWAEQALAQPWADSLVVPAETGTAKEIRFDAACAGIREPKKKEWILYGPGAEDRIAERLRALGFDVRPYEVDVADYRSYFATARYVEAFPDYYASIRAEKSLEHYLAAKLLQLGEKDVYIDIASEHSPAPGIYQGLFGVTAYRQDLAYPAGLRGDRIGGDAACMPVPDGFATKMALHCSFEHFEGESDIGFLREARRVLRPGGAVCVVPLYLFEEYAVQTDPEVAVPAGVAFEDDARVYCARGWGNRHGRFYDPEHLAERVLTNATGMTVEVYRITNAAQVDPSCYARFAMVIRKPPERPMLK